MVRQESPSSSNSRRFQVCLWCVEDFHSATDFLQCLLLFLLNMEHDTYLPVPFFLRPRTLSSQVRSASRLLQPRKPVSAYFECPVVTEAGGTRSLGCLEGMRNVCIFRSF